jgi:two-component sensor histidine kinase
MPLMLQLNASGPPKQLYLDFVYAPIVEASGEVSGIFVEGFDITDHMRAEEHLRLINDELQHRVKNTLTVVSAIASQTLRGTGNDSALKKFQGRLAAFANAHDSLTNANWVAASVQEVVEGALAPHQTGPGQFSLSGGDIIVGAKQALSLALAVHELATNAIKYGALTSDQGRVEISWNESLEQDMPAFRFLWQEIGGPAVEKPSKRGFGSQLIERVLTADFGKVEVSYEPTGLICRLTAPMDQIRAPASLDL